MLFRLVPLNQLQSVEDYLAGHHAGDVGPPPAWGGEGDDVYGPCAIAGDCLPFSGPPLGRGLRGADAHRRPAGQETQLCKWARGATAPASCLAHRCICVPEHPAPTLRRGSRAHLTRRAWLSLQACLAARR